MKHSNNKQHNAYFTAKNRARFEKSHWWYSGRRKIVMHLLKFLRLPRYAKALEIGCACGSNLSEISRHIDIFGGDIDAAACIYSSKKVPGRITAFDCQKLPFADCSFDVVLSLDILEHLEDDAAAVREIYRVLKDNGIALITVPCFTSLWGQHDLAEKHFRRYSKYFLKEILRKAGFAEKQLSYFNTILFTPIAVVRLLGKNFFKRKKIQVDFREIPQPINDILSALFSFERHFVTSGWLPFGLSLLAVVEKRVISQPVK
ncbi:MAG: methyltransferase domain-containing protein [Planctomycetota bacterium]